MGKIVVVRFFFCRVYMWTSSSCLVKPYQTGPWICVIRPLDQVTEPEPAAF